MSTATQELGRSQRSTAEVPVAAGSDPSNPQANVDVLKAFAVGGPQSTALANANITPGQRFRMSDGMVNGTKYPEDAPAGRKDVQGRRNLAEKAYMASIQKSFDDPLAAANGLNPMFAGPLGWAVQNTGDYTVRQMLKHMSPDVYKAFTTSSPLSTGLVPYDLMAPTWLIYAAMTPLRNRIPRTQGMGLIHHAKVLETVLGSQPNQYASPSLRISMSELNGGASLSTYPLALPPLGAQTSVDVQVPYKFAGLSEAASFLAQFSYAGFDDAVGLAALVLQQQFLLGEERMILSATGTAIGTGVTITGTARAKGTGETAITGYTSNLYVCATQVNYYGETAAGAVSSAIPITSNQVVDITIGNLQPGTLVTNLYVGTGATSAPPASTACYLMAKYVGGTLYTLQGALPTAGAPPTADTGTSSTNDYYGMFPILSGQAAANTSASGYPAGYLAGFYKSNEASELRGSVLANALAQVYNGSTTDYFADPTELWTSATDATNLAADLANATGRLNYQLLVTQDQVANVISGVAVSQFTNPVTRSTMRITVHPYFPQGSAVGLSYTINNQQSNVPNIWENVMVQDYLLLNWPIIDIAFRMSMFMFGTLFCAAPQYNFLLQGLQVSDSTPYS